MNLRRVGRSLVRQFHAKADDGHVFIVREFEVLQMVNANGTWMPVANGPHELELADGSQVFGYGLDDSKLIVDRSNLLLTPLDGETGREA